MSSITSVAIIGAGPYGLSLAAHLSAAGVPFRIFGEPMLSWSAKMPAGMRLKSDGFASDLYDPRRKFTLKAYCHEHGLPYADAGLPVEIDTFIGYGQAFQQAMVPTLERATVETLRRTSTGFSLDLSTGETVQARRTIVATGITSFENMPDTLAALPATLCSHSSARRDLTGFRGKDVVVIGGGSSATDIASCLRQQGARVTLVARHPLHFHEHQPRRSVWKRVTEPNFGLGPNLRSSLYVLGPALFRHLSAERRQRIVKHHLGPAGGWFVRDEVLGKVSILSDHQVRAAREQDQRVQLDIVDSKGILTTLTADHVIGATGYRVSLPRLQFLERGLIDSITVENGSPLLSGAFESSVPQLYFVGLAAALTFGPLLRFALGARFAARRVSAHLRRTLADDRTPANSNVEHNSSSVRQLGS